MLAVLPWGTQTLCSSISVWNGYILFEYEHSPGTWTGLIVILQSVNSSKVCSRDKHTHSTPSRDCLPDTQHVSTTHFPLELSVPTWHICLPGDMPNHASGLCSTHRGPKPPRGGDVCSLCMSWALLLAPTPCYRACAHGGSVVMCDGAHIAILCSSWLTKHNLVAFVIICFNSFIFFVINDDDGAQGCNVCSKICCSVVQEQ